MTLEVRPDVRPVGAPPRARRGRWIRPSAALALAAVLALGAVFAGAVFAGVVLADEDPSPKEIKKNLRQAILSGDDASLARILRKAGTIPGREATSAVLSTARSLPEDFDDAYWLLLDAVASYRHGDAFTEIASYILRHRTEPISRDLMNALRKSDSKYLGRVIRSVLADGSPDMRFMAIDLAPNAKVRRTVDILMPYLVDEHAKEKDGKKPPTEMKKRIIYALEALTLQRFGNSVPNWVGWWNANRARGLKILRQEAEEHESTTGLAQPIDPVRQRQLIGLEGMPPGKVLVIRAGKDRRGHAPNYDQIENVLSRIGIPHDVITRARVTEGDFRLDSYAAIFINCCQINEYCQNPDHRPGEFTGNRMHRCVGDGPHDTVSFAFTPDARKKLEVWTEKGGYLFTEDWALMDLLSLVWPKYVQPGSGTGGDWNRLVEQTVKIRPSRGFTAHPFLRGVFVPPPKLDWEWDEDEDDDDEADEAEEYDPTVEDDPGDVDGADGRTGVGDSLEPAVEEIPEPEIDLIRHQWKIDNESPSVSVRSKKVEVLIISPELDEQHGDPAVALTFPIKQGRVLHVISHFGKQKSSVDEATLENLLINFLIEVNIRIEQQP